MGENNDGARWWKNKAMDRWEPVAKGKETFTTGQSVAFFSSRDRRFFLTKKKESPGQVEFGRLGEE